jgi:MYXO-CTERM domain-containing protein
MTRSIRALSVAVVALAAGMAQAQTTLASFSYDSLSGGYVAASPANGVFTANAVDLPLLRTVGDFNRTVASEGNADFPAGFVTDANAADIMISLPVSVTSGTTASSVGGTITIVDIDGDSFTATVDGDWYNLGPGFAFFNGNLSGISFTDIGTLDGQFNGYNGSWAMNLPGNPLEGAIVNLVFGGQWFTQSFNDFAVGVSGQVIPTPGVAALLGLGGLVATRRRR